MSASGAGVVLSIANLLCLYTYTLPLAYLVKVEFEGLFGRGACQVRCQGEKFDDWCVAHNRILFFLNLKEYIYI